MKPIPKVFLVSPRNSQFNFGKLIQAIKKVNLEIEAHPRDENIVTSPESKNYSHDTPKFIVIDCSEVNKNTIKKIAKNQQDSASDQLFLKALAYYPTVIIITKLQNYLEKNYSDFKEIMKSATTYEEAANEIAKLIGQRAKVVDKLLS